MHLWTALLVLFGCVCKEVFVYLYSTPYRLARGNFDKTASDFDEIDDANVWLASCVPERGLGEANRGGGVRGHRR